MRKSIIFVLALLSLATSAFATSPTDIFREVLMQNAASATGNGTPVFVDYFTAIAVEVTITGTATITWEDTITGKNWNTGACVKSDSTTGVPATTATVSGLYHCNLAALTLFRARISSYSSGTVTAYARITKFAFEDISSLPGFTFAGASTPSDAFANPSTAILSIAFNMGWNGSSWDRLQVDGSKFLKVNCSVGCSGGATTPTDAFANPTTASLNMGFNMGWNGATWDRLQVDGSKFLKVNCSVGCSGGATTPTDAFANPTTAALNMTFNMGWNGATWDRLQVDGSKFLKVTQQGNITLSNAFLLDATYTGRTPAGASPADNESNTNTALSRIGTYTYVFDGTNWDRWTGLVTLGANQSVNVAQIAGTNTVTAAAGVQKVGVVGNAGGAFDAAGTNVAAPANEVLTACQFVTAPTTLTTTNVGPIQCNNKGMQLNQLSDGTTSVGVIAGTTALKTDVSSIAGTATVNGGLAGSLSIGGTAASNAAITQNPVIVAAQALSTQPVAATTGNGRQLVATLDGSLVVRPYGLITWSCNLTNIAATLTECQAVPGAGLSLYITDVMAQSNTGTAGTFTIRFGTGTNCGTGTGNLYYALATAVLFLPTNVSLPQQFRYQTPIKVTANNAVCVLGVATNTTNIQIAGFTAP